MMKCSHILKDVGGKPWVIYPSSQPFPNSGGGVVAFSNCQLSIVNCPSSPSLSKFSALYSKFFNSQGFLYAPFGEITTEYVPLWQNGTLPKYSFNAKELDEETGMYYYEARYYKPPVFTSRDPMFEKYFWMMPYAYCANNPVKYVDPSGKDLFLTGDNEDINSLLKIINQCFSFSSDVFTINEGKVDARELSDEERSGMTERQKALYDVMMSAINDENKISIGVVNNSERVFFGSWELSQIDIADIQAVGDGEGMNMYSVIGHEIAEQTYKQTTTDPLICIGHYRRGIVAEEKISGYYRGTEYLTDKSLSINFYKQSTINVVIISFNEDKSIKKVDRNPINLINK